jgi:hypothetical protein
MKHIVLLIIVLTAGSLNLSAGNYLALRKEYYEIRTMIVNGKLPEFQIYIRDSAEQLWPDGAPVVFVFAGNYQTDKSFFYNTLTTQKTCLTDGPHIT